MFRKFAMAAICLAASQVGFGATDVKGQDKDFVWYCESDEATEAQKVTVAEIYYHFDLEKDKVSCQEAKKHINKSFFQRIVFKDVEHLTDLSPIAGLNKLSSILCNVCSQTAFDTLPAMPTLKHLDFSSTELESLHSLDRYPSLETLKLTLTPLSDIDELKGNTKIKTLAIGGTKINDLSAIQTLTNLSYLNLSNSDATVLDTFSGHGGIEFLVLNDMGLKEIPDATKTPNLKDLELASNQITSLQGIKGYKKLQALTLSYNPIDHINPNEIQTNLTELYLLDLPLNNYNFLKHFKDLKKLSVGFSETVTWRDINHLLPKLTKLGLYYVKIGQKEIPMNTLERWENMKSFYLLGTNIDSLEFFKRVKAPNLENFGAPDIADKTEENCPTSGVPAPVARFCKDK